MTDTNNNNENTASKEGVTIEHNANEPKPVKNVWPLSAKIGIALAAVIGIGAVAAQSAGGFGPKGGPFGGGFHAHHVNKALEKVDATSEQEQKIDAIIERMRTELAPVGDSFRETRKEAMTLLAAPSVDAAALEKLRAERVAAIDDASKKTVAAMVEAAQVLTPEQRAKLITEMQDHMGRRW